MATQEFRRRARNALREPKYMQELINMLAPTTGEEFYVSSTHATTSATNTGLASDEALTTLALAVAKCTANQGDVIHLMPGHNESLTASVSINVAGITIIGHGQGSARPRFDYDLAAAELSVAASGIAISNITLLPSVTDVLIGIDIVTLMTDTLLEDIEALPGEDGAGVDDFAAAIELKAGCTRTKIKRFKQRCHASAAGYIAGIRLNDQSDDVLIEDCDIVLVGAALTACILGITTLCLDLNIRGCRLTADVEPGVEVVTAGTGIIEDTYIFANIANIDDATVADGMAHFECYYVEVGNEAGALIKTPSVDG